jgi:glucose-6-phosphate dehydrogenase assembly protein OpcA
LCDSVDCARTKQVFQRLGIFVKPPTIMANLVNAIDLGREVPLPDIDRELRKLWEADTARTKASLLNLVVYSEQPGSLLENSSLARELTRAQACRAILVEIDRSEPAITTRAWITAHCHLAAGRKAVCSEQIAFLLTGSSTGRLRNIVFSHLASDLPLVLWWQGELSPLFMESLYHAVDRMIFDSADWRDPAAAFDRIAEALRVTAGRLVVQDLEWTRSYALRLAVAALFDEPAAAASLTDIDTLRIVHQPAHRNAALQFLAWFATQAGWQYPAPSAPSSISANLGCGLEHRRPACDGQRASRLLFSPNQQAGSRGCGIADTAETTVLHKLALMAPSSPHGDSRPLTNDANVGRSAGDLCHPAARFSNELDDAGCSALERFRQVSFSFRRPGGGPAGARLAADPAGAPLGLLEATGPGVSLTVSAAPGAPQLQLHCQTGTRTTESLLPATPDDPVHLLAEQLSRGGRNSLLRKVLPMFRSFLANLTSQ